MKRTNGGSPTSPIPSNRGSAATSLADKRRDRAVEAVGNGAQQFGFAGLNGVIEGNGLGAGGENVLLYLRDRLGEPIKGRVEMSQVAVGRRKPRNFRAGD